MVGPYIVCIRPECLDVAHIRLAKQESDLIKEETKRQTEFVRTARGQAAAHQRTSEASEVAEAKVNEDFAAKHLQ